MVDVATQKKWDKLAPRFDVMAGKGPEVRWKPFKERLFSHMDGRILFLALGTGLDIATFPPGKDITAIDISPKMLEQAEERIWAYDGNLHAEVMDVHEMTFEPDSFDLIVNVGALHHVQYLDRLCRILCKALKPGGVLVGYDYVGPSRNQYSRRH